MIQKTITTEWQLISGTSCAVWLDQQEDGASGSMDIRCIVSSSIPSSIDFTIARHIYTPNSNSDSCVFNIPFGKSLYAKCKDGTGTITVSTDAGLLPTLQTSYTKGAFLTTDYERDYITRGNAFEVQRRITLTSGQTLYLEFNIALAVGKLVYSLPIKASTNGGNVFLDTYLADSSSGGSVLMVPNNLNGLSSNVAMTTVRTVVSVSGTPSNLREYSVGAKSTNQAAGGGVSEKGFAKILNNSKPLYFKFVNQETSTVTLDLGFIWYEI